MNEPKWYFLEGSTSTGPFSRQRMLDMSRAGIIGHDAFVWREGTPDWVPLTEALKATESKDRQPPPLPGRHPRSVPDAVSAAAKSSAAMDFAAPEPLVRVASSQSSRPDSAPLATRDGWTSVPVAPWRRYGARMLDTMVNALIGFTVLGYLWFSVAPRSADKFLIFVTTPAGIVCAFVLATLLPALVGGLMTGLTGSSLGKLIFGVRVLGPDLRIIGVGQGMAREFHVWFTGLAVGIPLIAMLTMIGSYRRLKRTGVTSWDDGRHVVVHRPSGWLQTVLNIVGIVLILFMNMLVQALDSR